MVRLFIKLISSMHGDQPTTRIGIFLFFLFCIFFSHIVTLRANELIQPKTIAFQSGKLILYGVIYIPKGKGPFPGVLYNHGSAAAMSNNKVSDILGPLYASHGWVFFMPYRRGQGLSASAGSYILDEVNRAREKNGDKAASKTMLQLLTTDHLNDQLAALVWFRKQNFIRVDRIAVVGDSLGGIETIFGAEKGEYCAAVDVSGAAKIWNEMPEIQEVMMNAARNAKVPIFFVQTKNDYSVLPGYVLSTIMRESKKEVEFKIYPAFGQGIDKNHTFAYLGNSIWAPDVFSFLKKYCLVEKQL